VPKSRKSNKPGEENRTAWRTPVKLPATAASVEPMKSLYVQNSSVSETEPQIENAEDVVAPNISARLKAETTSPFQENSNSLLESESDEPQKQFSTTLNKGNINTESPSAAKQAEAEKTPTGLGEAEFLRLLKTEKMDFYSLAEILRGSSMALYCVLYSESLAKGENRCQIRQTDLMMRAEINNPATGREQEKLRRSPE
jgi:hypothetical protein